MKKKKQSKLILTTALISIPVLCANLKNESSSASESIALLEFKNAIFRIGATDSISDYDLNHNNKTDVFDLIRCKQTIYHMSDKKPEETTAATTPKPTTTTVTTTNTPEPTTTTVITTTTPEPTTTTVTATTTPEPTTTTVITTTTPEPTTTTVTTTTTPEPTTTTVTTTPAPPVTTVNTTAAPAPPATEMPKRKIISNMKSLLQAPQLPTGCEATGLTIAINWYGYDVDKVDIATKFMPQMPVRYVNGIMTGPDFVTTFAGNPTQNELSYGCYIPCLMTTAENYFASVGSSYKTKNLTGTELPDLFQYIAKGTPVVLISTPELVTPRTGDSWYTPDGRHVTWQRGHHCMVLMGYDLQRNKVYCADPMMIRGIVEYDYSQFKRIYDLKGKNAMIIDTGSVAVPKAIAAVGDKIKYSGYIHGASDAKDGENESYISGTYTVTHIYDDTSIPYRVSLDQMGWVSYDALYTNIPTYGNSSADGIVNNRVYNIRNKQSSKYLNVDYGIDKDGTNIYQWSKDNSTEQKFRLQSHGDAYKIYAMCSSGGTHRLVSAQTLCAGANIHLYAPGNDATEDWIFKSIGNGEYTISLKSDPTLVFTVRDNGNGSASGQAGNVYLEKYQPGASSQIWYLS